MSAKRAVNDKLQGSGAAYLRCGGVANNKLRTVYCWVCEEFFLISEYLAKLQAITWSSRAPSSSLAVCCPGTQSAWDNHVIPCNFAKYSWENIGTVLFLLAWRVSLHQELEQSFTWQLLNDLTNDFFHLYMTPRNIRLTFQKRLHIKVKLA